MRIVGYLDHERFKVTVFRMDNRLAVKFEDGGLEQVYKFRLEDRLTNLADVQRLVDPDFLAQVERVHQLMVSSQAAVIRRQLPPREEDFPTII